MSSKRERKPLVKVFACLATSLVGISYFAMGQEDTFSPEDFDTGMVFESPDSYEALPKRKRTRGVVMFDRIDLSSYFPPAGNQSAQGSCGSWAVGYGARSYYLAADTGPLGPAEAISPAYIFNQISPGAFDETVRCSGTTFTAALDLIKDVGAVDMDTWPYDPTTCRPTPTDELLNAAASNRIPNYSSFNVDELKDTRRFKEVLAAGHPIVIAAMIVVKDHLSYRGGVYSRPELPEEGIGGHGMVLVGFDDEKQAFLLYNSWGEAWGENGKMWIDYETFHSQVREAYVIEGLAPPQGVFAASAAGLPSHTILAADLAADLNLDLGEEAAETTALVPGGDLDEPEEEIEGPDLEPEPEPEPTPLTLAEKRDSLDQMISELRCGSAELVRADTDRLVGFAGPEERNDLISAARLIHPEVEVEVKEMAWPTCEVAMMLPADNVDTNLNVTVDTLADLEAEAQTGKTTLVKGKLTRLQNEDRFRIAAGASKGPSYFQVFYLQADQSAKEIFRGETKSGDLDVFGVAIGDQVAGLRSSPPFGAEALLVMASDAPIIDAELGVNVAEYDFINRLQDGLEVVAADGRDFVSVLYPLQVLGQDDAAISTNSLLTDFEYDVLSELFGADVPDVSRDPVQIIQERGALGLTLIQNDGALTFDTDAEGALNYELWYRTPSGLVDITPRLNALSERGENTIRVSEFTMPSGAHRLRFVAKSDTGEVSALEFTIDQGGKAATESTPIVPQPEQQDIEPGGEEI